ncbi:PEP-CTERM sorting domain-containing protein [Laspinema olomoucense]|uniref:PEP-CTERM sorting domain-containing protein n=1 Tax=Laspinema olomoucense TaxID=3231600 RepID=UPI0021BAFDEE|nr:PEP-CTERM sorting domain-containing protein [Laspinema sp. D3c]MCT7993844.1 PEP-CTERM sorting domain-containing protein [Laspinema sp. D3c]
MSLNLFTRTTLAITGAVFSLGTVAVNPASAARITYDFSVNNDPSVLGPLRGRLSYDEATEVKSGYEFEDITHSPWGYLRYDSYSYKVDFIEFSFFDQVYTQADALSPISLYMGYTDGHEMGKVLSWETEDFWFRGWGYRMEAIWTEFYRKTPDGLMFDQTVNFSRVQAEPTPVPEPSILGALSVLGLAGLLGKKRVKAQLPD